MKFYNSFLPLLIFTIINISFGQSPFKFNEISRSSNYGTFDDAALGKDNIIFVEKGFGGLHAYAYNDSTFYHIAGTLDGSSSYYDVAVRSDGIIFTTNYTYNSGLLAFKFENNSFELLASADVRGGGTIAFGPDGTIFYAMETGLIAYEFENSIFQKKAEYGYSSHNLNRIKVDEYGTIFLTMTARNALQAYHYTGDKLIQIAETFHSYRPTSIALREDGIIFVGTNYETYAYTYTDSAFQLIDHILESADQIEVIDSLLYLNNSELNIYTFNDSFRPFISTNIKGVKILTIQPHGDIIVSNEKSGMQVFRQVGSEFRLIRQINDSGEPQDVAFDSNGKIYLANGYGGLHIYNSDHSALNREAYINNDSFAMDVFVNSNGTIYLACADSGLYAYEYADGILYETAHINDGGNARGLDENSDGTIFIANGVDIRAYNYTGSSFTDAGHISTEAVSIVVDDADNIYAACGNEGPKVYQYENGSFSLIAKIPSDEWFESYDIDVNKNGVIFSSGLFRALSAFEIQDSLLTEISFIPNYDYYATWEKAVDVGADGTIFRITDGREAGVSYGLFGLDYNDTTFTVKAFSGVKHYTNVSVRDDGYIFASTPTGVVVYELVDNTTSIISSTYPDKFSLEQNYPNPFNSATKISFNTKNHAYIVLEIFNLHGQRIKTLVNKSMPAGDHSVEFNAQNISSGIYYYRLRSNNSVRVRKMVYLK